MAEFDKAIPPGGVGKIKASIKTDHFKGMVSKGVSVTTNDPEKSVFSLQIKADVQVPIDVVPGETMFLNGRPGENPPNEITMTSTDGKPFDVVSIEADPALDVRLLEPAPAKASGGRARAPLASGSTRYKLSVAPAPEALPGRSVAKAVVSTTHPKVPTITLQVNLMIPGDVEVQPERLLFRTRPAAPVIVGGSTGAAPPPPAAPAETALVQHVRLKKPKGEPLKILGIECSDPSFVATPHTVVQGREIDIEVRYVGKPPERGYFSGKVLVRTNVPRQTTIEIPVNAGF